MLKSSFRYVKLLVNHPRKIIVTVLLICSSTILIPCIVGRLPQFSQPELVSINYLCNILFIIDQI